MQKPRIQPKIPETLRNRVKYRTWINYVYYVYYKMTKIQHIFKMNNLTHNLLILSKCLEHNQSVHWLFSLLCVLWDSQPRLLIRHKYMGPQVRPGVGTTSSPQRPPWWWGWMKVKWAHKGTANSSHKSSRTASGQLSSTAPTTSAFSSVDKVQVE